jgi:hypothetical protein
LANPGSPNVTANVVWGQNGDFTTNCDTFVLPLDAQANARLRDPFGATATTLAFPTDVRVDVLGNLYIADGMDDRVLEFNTPLADPSSPNLTANAVYGRVRLGSISSALTPESGRREWRSRRESSWTPQIGSTSPTSATIEC